MGFVYIRRRAQLHKVCIYVADAGRGVRVASIGTAPFRHTPYIELYRNCGRAESGSPEGAGKNYGIWEIIGGTDSDSSVAANTASAA